MERSLTFIICLSLVLIFSLSIISAFSFSDLWGKITGKVVETGKVWDMVASNDPNDYLGDYVNEEVYSDWKHYKPMVDKVNELTEGLTNDEDKAKTIFKWVWTKYAGKEDEELLSTCGANRYNATIIEIFNCPIGICLDYAMLETAMLRLVNIPARVVGFSTASTIFHAESETYINGRWIEIYPSWEEDRSLQFRVRNITAMRFVGFRTFSNNLFVKHIKLTDYAEKREIVSIGEDKFNVMNVTYFERKIIPRTNYGYIYYPITTELVACKLDIETGKCLSYSLEFNDIYQGGDSFQWSLTLENLICDAYDCYTPEEVEMHYLFGVSLAIPGSNYYKGFFIEHPEQKLSDVVACNEPCWYRAHPNQLGYIKTTLHPGKYTFKYKAENSAVTTAYYPFEVEEGNTVLIKPEMLLKSPEADQSTFDVLIHILGESVSGIPESEFPIELPREIVKEETEAICSGCVLEDRCYPVGYRKEDKYCSEGYFFIPQVKSDVCENDYECQSDSCINGKCYSPGFFQKIIDWFKRLFGIQ